jgi:hypothetical protein
MKKTLLALSAVMALTACNDSSSDTKEEAQEILEINESLETTKVKLQFNLPSASQLLDTQSFTYDDSLTYNSSVGTLVCDPEGTKISLDVNFVHVESNKWDVYFKLNDEFLNVDGGESGGTGQNKATLEFDDNGNFIRQVPYIIKSEEIQYSSDKTYSIELDFYSDSTTNIDESFNAKNFDTNGC